jgi:hypothetical protein
VRTETDALLSFLADVEHPFFLQLPLIFLFFVTYSSYLLAFLLRRRSVPAGSLFAVVSSSFSPPLAVPSVPPTTARRSAKSCQAFLSFCSVSSSYSLQNRDGENETKEVRKRLNSVSSLRRLDLRRRLPVHIEQLRSRLFRRYPQFPRHKSLQPRIVTPTLIHILELPPLRRKLEKFRRGLLQQVDRSPHEAVFAREFGGVGFALLTGVEAPGSEDRVVGFGGGDYLGECGETVCFRRFVLVQRLLRGEES